MRRRTAPYVVVRHVRRRTQCERGFKRRLHTHTFTTYISVHVVHVIIIYTDLYVHDIGLRKYTCKYRFVEAPQTRIPAVAISYIHAAQIEPVTRFVRDVTLRCRPYMNIHSVTMINLIGHNVAFSQLLEML